MQILITQYTVNQAVRASAHQAALIGGPDWHQRQPEDQRDAARPGRSPTPRARS